MAQPPSPSDTTETTPDVLTERVDHVLVVTFNRPERMNSIGGDVIGRLSEIFLEAEHDPDVRAIVLTGAGRAFCSGLDLKDVSSGSTNVTNSSAGFKINETPPFVMRRMDTPIVCALNGAAAGYGMDMALGCDFILASDRARFVPPVRRGVIPESGGTWLLPRLVGWHKACEITLLARVLEAPDIERLGLDSTFEANSNAVMADLMQLFRGEDFKESLIAFMEKRPAKYQGR